MKTMKNLGLAIAFVLLYTPLVRAQNSCAGPDPVNSIANPTQFYMVSRDHAAVDAAKNPILSDYTMEVRLGTQAVSNFTMPKTSMTLQSGTPANCYRVPLPAMSGLLPTNMYQIAVRANGPNCSMPTPCTFTVSSNSFFVSGAPAAPENLRLALLNMLQRVFLQPALILGFKN